MWKSVLYFVVGEVYVLMMGWLCGSSDGGRKAVYRQTSCNKSTGRKKVREIKKEKRRKKEEKKRKKEGRKEWAIEGDGSFWV